MIKQSIISENTRYTFSDYFKMNHYTTEIVAHFGYSFEVQSHAELPRAAIDVKTFADLRKRLEESLPHLVLTSEAARREFLIAPILLEIVRLLHAEIRVEYALEVTPQLQGTLDYLLRSQENLLVVEAKQADLQRGFTQLAVELIALDYSLASDAPYLFGAVTTGDAWRFGILNRDTKHLVQDFNLYDIPADIEILLQILIAILTSSNS